MVIRMCWTEPLVGNKKLAEVLVGGEDWKMEVMVNW